MNPLEILGLEPGAEEKDVETRWLSRVSHYQPGQPLEKPGEYDENMEAYLTLLGKLMDFKQGPDGRIDWVPVYIASKQKELEGLRSEGVVAEKDVRSILKALPAFLSMERLEPLRDFNVTPILQEMLPLQEFKEARDLPQTVDAFEITFRASRWSSLGATIDALSKPIPQRERILWAKTGYVPLWRITINLALWILSPTFDRKRIIHRELSRCWYDTFKERARSRGADINGFTATFARFGLANETEATAIAAAMSHPDVGVMVDAAGWDSDQGLLFAPFRRTKELGTGDPFLASLADRDRSDEVIEVDVLPGGNGGEDSDDAEEDDQEEEPGLEELEADVRRKALKALLTGIGAGRLEDVTPKHVNSIFDAVKEALDVWGSVESFVHYVTEVCQGLRPTTERAIKAWGTQDVVTVPEGGQRRRARG